MAMIQYDYKDSEEFNTAIENLYTIVTLLRSPEGCPWDRAQTTKKNTAGLLDETYEYIDALNNEDIPGQREEIGDVLLNVLMNLRIHEEQDDFRPQDAVNEICRKLIHRHPHVFGDETAASVDEVLSIWDNVKKTEKKKEEENIFSHIPSALPPLEMSYEVQKKMAKVGFDWDDVRGIIEKVSEELCEVEEAIAAGDSDEIEMEIGDLLFSVVNLSRFMKVRPNIALDRSNRKVIDRFLKLSKMAKDAGIPLDKDHNEEMNKYWDRIKEDEKKNG